MKKKTISGILAVVICLSMLPLVVAQADTDEGVKNQKKSENPTTLNITSGVTIAVNTDTSTEEQNAGSFSTDIQAEAGSMKSNILGSGSEMVGVSDYIVDEMTGQVIYQKEKALPKLTATYREENGQPPKKSLQPASYKVGDKQTMTEAGDDEEEDTPRVAECLYVGTYCTVWGDTETDPEEIRLTKYYAEMIGKEFDKNQPTEIASFGPWYDRDGDGKLAIFCYDIDQDYANKKWSNYTAGYFFSTDMCDESGNVNNYWRYDPTSYHGMTIDCIHLDTYPGMSWQDNPFGDIERIYHTMVHEFQHMINFSYVANSMYAYDDMETYLDEAFSMAAEHMIYKPTSTKERIDYFNTSGDYVLGTPLTYWKGTLSSYANSYLFGQYLRTRYAQIDPNSDNGNTLFKHILQVRQKDCGRKDTLSMIADLLGTTKLNLVTDFWIAVYKKDVTGNYGFNGENWADSIKPLYSNTDSTGEIYNGGVRFYESTLTAKSTRKIEITTIQNGVVQKGDVPLLSNVQVIRTGKTMAQLKATPSKGGKIYYRVSDTPILKSSDMTSYQTLTANTEVTVNLTGLTNTTEKVYYYVVGNSSTSDVIYSADISVDDLSILVRHVAKIETITDSVALEELDINEDGSVNAADITALAQKLDTE